MPSSRTRARDADRDALCRVLDKAFEEGQLDGAEHRDRTTTALKARTLGELRGLVDDLQLTDSPTLSEPEPPRAPRRRSARWVGLAVTLLLLGAGFGIGRATAPSGPSSPVAVDEQVAAQGGPVALVEPRVVQVEGLHTPEGWARFVSDVRERLGTTVIADAVVYPGYAVLTTAVAGNAAREERWDYRGGLNGPDSPGTRNADDPLVDLAAFTPEVLMPLIAGAPASLKVAEADSVYVTISDDGSGPRARIYASNEFNESGYLEARPDGSLLSVRPHEAS